MRDHVAEAVEVHTAVRPERATVLVFPDQVDIANAPALRARVLQLLNQGTRSLELDLTQCSFCDSSGVDVILRSHLRATALGAHLAIRLPPTGVVARVCQITGVTRAVTVLPAPAQ
ncbi:MULTISPECIES: STAS domain-containing protein [unclassified Spirillospora]|uniref:STAS domain-containing protein n=1 Tax=unclassified Spirillospora TaxID=2642701 RepID=UPI003712C205